MTDYQMRTIIRMMIRIVQLNENKEEAVKQMEELLEQLPEPKEKE